MRLLLAASLLSVTLRLFAQQSLFETGDGKTALYLRQPAGSINLGDSKANLSYVHDFSESPVFYGADVYATANSGVASLFSTDKPKAPEGGLDGVLGFRHDVIHKGDGEFTPTNIRYMIDVGYGRSSFRLYPTGTTISPMISKTDFNRFRSVAVFNVFRGWYVFGLAGGAEKRNNLSDLQAVSLSTVIVPPPAGGTSSVVNTQSGYYGSYKVYVAAPVYEDFLIFMPAFKKPLLGVIGNRFGLDILSRSEVAAVNRQAAGGFGLFFLDKKDPYKTIGGVTATYDGRKFQLSLTTGFTGK